MARYSESNPPSGAWGVNEARLFVDALERQAALRGFNCGVAWARGIATNKPLPSDDEILDLLVHRESE